MNDLIEKYLNNADIAFLNGQYKTALEFCLKVLEIDTKNADAYLGAGKVCLILDKLDDAASYFEKAVELDNYDSDKHFNLGNIKFMLGKYTEALSHYAKAEQLDCDVDMLQKIYYQIGIINYILGDKKSAIINLTKSENTGNSNPDMKNILFRKIHIYLENKEYTNAENAAIQLKLLVPNEYTSYQTYFQVLIAMKKYEKAEQILIEAELYADDRNEINNKTNSCLNRGVILVIKANNEPDSKQKYFEEALNNFDLFLDQDGLNEYCLNRINFAKAEILLKLENFKDAIDSISKVKEDHKNKDTINFMKLTCYVGLEDYSSAHKYILALSDVKNDYYKHYIMYIDAFIAQKNAEIDDRKNEIALNKYNLAIAYFKNRMLENPTDLYALAFRARLYAENKKFEKAEEIVNLLPESAKRELEKYIHSCR